MNNFTTPRSATLERTTTETSVCVEWQLDGSGQGAIQTTIPFVDHMLTLLAKHGYFDLTIKAKGDTDIDDHHTVEDIGITLGQAFAQALADKKGIRRYGHAYVPLDEALSRVVIDFSGRPGLEYDIDYPRSMIGEFDVDLLGEFFQGFVNHANVTLHIDNISGNNAHHIAETIFKAVGRAVRMALTMDERMQGVLPSTKGAL